MGSEEVDMADMIEDIPQIWPLPEKENPITQHIDRSPNHGPDGRIMKTVCSSALELLELGGSFQWVAAEPVTGTQGYGTQQWMVQPEHPGHGGAE